jgi:hypothetical protein
MNVPALGGVKRTTNGAPGSIVGVVLADDPLHPGTPSK